MTGDYKRNRTLSLKEKLKLNYEEKKRKFDEKKKNPMASTPNFLKKIGKFIDDNPKFLDKTGQFCCVFGTGGLAIMGITVTIPFLYSNFSEWYTASSQIFSAFCVLQLIINWFSIRMVTSAYVPAIHGAKPDNLEIGEHISKLDKANNVDSSVSNPGNSQTLVKRNIVYVATEMPKSNTEPPKRTAFPYWSWAPCLRCNRPRPPRCHHCSICHVCVMKRDHHCFITGRCIGYRNLRHFAVFIFWTVVITTYGTVHFIPYTYYVIKAQPELGYIDLILPVTLIRAIFGFLRWRDVLLITLDYIVVIYNIWSAYTLVEIAEWIREGTTSFEKMLKFKIYDTRSLKDKLRSVFGHYWILNFIVPLHFVFEPIEDPINWTHVKA